MISESSSEEVTAGWATSDTDEYGTVVGVSEDTVLGAVVEVASCSCVARKASASSPAELERGRPVLEGEVLLDAEPSRCLSPELWLDLEPEPGLCGLRLPLPPMIETTLPSVTEQGEIPSIALAASKRSSRLMEEVLLFLLLGGQLTLPVGIF